MKPSKITNVSKTLLEGLGKSVNSARLVATDVILFLTYRCTSKCSYCNIWQRSDHKDLSWEEWEPILQKLAKSNIKSIELFGGDALIRKDLMVKMIQFCREAGIETYFPTNSNLLREKTAKALVEAGLDTIYFSLDESPSMGGAIRGVSDHFQKVVRGIEYVKKYRGSSSTPKIECMTTVSKDNYRALEELYDHVLDLDVESYVLRGMSDFQREAIQNSAVDGIEPEPYFVPIDGDRHWLTIEEAKELLEIVDRIKRKSREDGNTPVSTTNMDHLTPEDLVTWKYPRVDCLFCTTQMVLAPSGDVLPCPYFNNYVLGNLKDEEVSEVWGNEKHRQFTSQQQKDKIELCSYCSIKYYHRSFGDTVKKLTNRAKKRLLSS